MKFLYLTDSHLRATSPKSRLDNFFESSLLKHKEVFDLANKYEVDAVLHGGDLFDRPDVSIAVVSEFSKLLMDLKAPFYIVSGNHDIYGHNPETIPRTMLGLLNSIGLVHLIKDKPVVIEKDKKVKIYGTPYIYGMDRDDHKDAYIVQNRSDEDYILHIIHGFLIDKPINEVISHTLISDIVETKADITLAGHYHTGFKTQCIQGKYFINPGAIVRISNNLVEMKRRPKVVLINLEDGIQLEEIYLKSAKPGPEVLDRSEIEQHQFKKAKLHEFQELIEATTDFSKTDVFELIDEISSTNEISQEIREEALKRVSQVQESESSQ